MNHRPINWARISWALAHYDRAGYQYVEVPWIVPSASVLPLLPSGKVPLETPDGVLVGSAEQSFLHLMQSGQLSSGRCIAASPCFRDDPPDELHHRTFFKVELIQVLPALRLHLDLEVHRMAEDARKFFRRVQDSGDPEIIQTPEGLDINLNGVEIGSYGVHQVENFCWIYGTGLAEPRFSQAVLSRNL